MRLVRTAFVLAIGLLLGASAVAIGVGGDQQYTGCLAKDGTLSKIAVGTAPKLTCSKTETQITWNQTGATGASGTAILNGSGAPAADLGRVGDFYIDTDADSLYGPKTADGWGLGESLVGPKGDKGNPGDPGPANLAALAGSACTAVGSSTGTLAYAVDPATGAVTLTCVGITYHVAANSTNGETFDFRIHDSTTRADVAYCSNTTTCAADIPAGHSMFVMIYYSTYFSLTCPGGAETMPEWTGSCSTSSLSSDFSVSVEGW